MNWTTEPITEAGYYWLQPRQKFKDYNSVAYLEAKNMQDYAAVPDVIVEYVSYVSPHKKGGLFVAEGFYTESLGGQTQRDHFERWAKIEKPSDS